jgi:competence protein ComEA
MKLNWVWIAALTVGCAGAQDGRALLEQVCTKCHSLTATTAQHNSKDRWTEIVDSMVARGAEGTDEEFEKIVDYLTKNYGPRVAVNKAAAGELASALEIPGTTASAIVAYREKNGPFQTVEDLKKVDGVDAADLEKKKGRIDFKK